MRMRNWPAWACIGPFLLLSFACRNLSPAKSSLPSEIGGDPSTFSCGTVFNQIDRYDPLLKSAKSDFASTCGAGNETMDLTAPTGLSASCKDRVIYLTRVQKYVDALLAQSAKRPCLHGFNDKQTEIFEHPTCGFGGGCNDLLNRQAGTSCFTCEYDSALPGLLDNRGTITCQSESTARQAVSFWCDRRGQNCETAKISCRRAIEGVSEPSLSGTLDAQSISAVESISVRATARVEGNAFGSKVSGMAEVGVGVSGSFDIALINGSAESFWVKRGDRTEANEKATATCATTVTGFVAHMVEGGVEVGFKLAGNGATAGMTVNQNGRLSQTRLMATQPLTAAGLTRAQIIQRCKDWSVEALKFAIEQSFEITVPSVTQETLLTHDIFDKGVQCSYPNGASYRLVRLWVKFHEQSATIQYEVDDWINWDSDQMEVPNSELGLYLKDLETNEISRERLATLIHAMAQGHASAKWKTLHCE